MPIQLTRSDNQPFYVGASFTVTHSFTNLAGDVVDPSTTVANLVAPDGTTTQPEVTTSSNARIVTIDPQLEGKYHLDFYSASLDAVVKYWFHVESSVTDALYLD